MLFWDEQIESWTGSCTEQRQNCDSLADTFAVVGNIGTCECADGYWGDDSRVWIESTERWGGQCFRQTIGCDKPGQRLEESRYWKVIPSNPNKNWEIVQSDGTRRYVYSGGCRVDHEDSRCLTSDNFPGLYTDARRCW